MSGREGYTLVEMLVALAVLGLAVGGLTQGILLLSRFQTRATGLVDRAAALRAAEGRLAALLSPPCDATTLSGDSHALTLICEGGQKTRVVMEPRVFTVQRAALQERVNLPSAAPELSYLATDGQHATWPVGVAGSPRLVAVMVSERNAAAGSPPISMTRVYASEPSNCDFDPIALRCRGLGR